MWAAVAGRGEVIARLLSHGASIDAVARVREPGRVRPVTSRKKHL